MADLRYKICLKLGYDDGVKGTQHCIITEKNFEDIIALIKAHSLQERMSELEMFKKVPLTGTAKDYAAHISRRYEQLEAEQEAL